LILFLRSAELVLLASFSVFAPVLWLLGAIATTGYCLSSFTTLLLPVTLTVALTTTIYTMNAYVSGHATPGREPLADIAVPQTLCAMTNCLGYASLVFTPIPVIQQFGLWATAGGALTLLAAFYIVPIGIRLIRYQPRPVVEGRLDHRLGALGRWMLRRPRMGAISWAFAFLVCVAGSAGFR